MNLDDFKKNVITQKNVITHQASVIGGNGTQTKEVKRTAIHSNQLLQLAADVVLGADVAYKNDNIHDWDDEGTC